MKRLVGYLKTRVSQWTIQREITLTILITSLLPLILSNFYLYSRINALHERQITEYSRQVIRQAASNLENLVHQTDLAKKQIIYWTIVNRLLSPASQPEEEFRRNADTKDLISNLRINFPFLRSIYIVNEEKVTYTEQDGIYQEDISRELIDKLYNPLYTEVVLPPRERHYSSSGSPALLISFTKQIRDFSAGGKHGLIQIDIDFASVGAILDEVALGEGSAIYLLSANRNFPYLFDKTGMPVDPLLLEQLKERPRGGKDRILITSEIEESGWSLVGVIPVSTLRRNFQQLRIVTILLVIILSFAAVLAGLLLANRITLPLTDVVDKIYRFGKGDFSQKLPDFNNHDLRILAENFNRMTSRIEGLMTEAVEREKEKETAELIALQAQINPHFLYNTLEVIRGISLQKKIPEISSIVKSLACIFRYSIDREEETVPLARELDNLKHYLNVQAFRFIDRFSFRDHLADALRDRKVPRLILQPIVENIFKHVIEERKELTAILLDAVEEEDYLVLTVSNTGKGIAAEECRRLNDRLKADSNSLPGSHSPSIGLANVHNRLCRFNGSSRGLEILSEEQSVTVKLWIRHNEPPC